MIRVRAFARYRELLGFTEMEFPMATTIEDLLWDARFKSLPSNALIAVNQVFAHRKTPLKDGDEVAFMPPVSGG